MLRRLRRPGYWIVLLAFLTVYFYQQYRKNEEIQRRETLHALYRDYGAGIFKEMRSGELSRIQDAFLQGGKGKLSLEDVALFVETFHLDKSPGVVWKEIDENQEGVALHGRILGEGNASYPMDMMLVKQGKKLLLNRLKIGSKVLELKQDSFPFDTTASGDENISGNAFSESNRSLEP